MGEGPVGLGHLVGVLAALHGSAEPVGGIQDLVHEPLGHGLLAAGAGEADEPAHGQCGLAPRFDLDRHLVGGAADATGLDLNGGLDVVEGPLQGLDGVLAGLGAGALEGVVDDGLGHGLLAVEQDLADELAHQRGAVDRIDHDGALGRWSLARHYFSFFAP